MTDNDSSKKKLSSSAKAFIPQSVLKASASSWTPGKTAAEVVAAPAPAKKEETNTKKPVPSNNKPAEKAPAAAPAPAPKAPVMAWGKRASSAIKAAPTPEQEAQAQAQNANAAAAVQASNNQRGGRDGRDNNGNRNGNQKGGWRKQNRDNNKENNKNWRLEQKKNHNNNRKQDGDNDGGGGGWQRGKLIPLDLLKPGEEGDSVKRIHVNELLVLRLSFVAPPLKWDAEKKIGPPTECRWESDTRVQEIDAQANKQRLGGDVSSHRRRKKENETAPPLEECKPLEVNEETRWKANVFKKEEADNDNSSNDSDDVVLKKSLMILNKLSLTKFDKLSDAFIDTGIGRNEKCLTGAIELVVKKAQDEPHFAAMYAALCQKLSKTPMAFEEPGKKKKFKKILLTVCQSEFDDDTEQKIAKAIEGIEDEEDIQLKKDLVKKHYLGHMRFIGELYKGDLISIKIMLVVLSGLLEQEAGIDEEKVECFTKLMTVIGDIIEQQCHAQKSKGKMESSEKLEKCWDLVRLMAGRSKEKGPDISNRIKFMLQDLLEMKENGWTSRREVESAKTIAQIHKEAAREARRGSTGSVRRSTSTNSLKRQAKATTDADGFTEVLGPTGGFNRSLSMGNFPRNNSRSNLTKQSPKRSSSIKSSGGSFAAFNEKSQSTNKIVEEPPKPANKKKVEYLEPSECSKKVKNYLKEFFVSGDADDAVLSIHELVGVGADGSIDRGAKVVEGGTLMVLEMKAEEVDKFLLILTRCYTEKKIEAASILSGLNDPLEFLSDIAIDAPLASTHMATIVAAFVKAGAIQFDSLLNAPEYFRTDGGAAGFGCKVLKKIGDDASQDESNIAVIEKLMTDDDKAQFPSAKDLLAS